MFKSNLLNIYRLQHLEDYFRGCMHMTIEGVKYKNCLWWPCLLTDQYEMNNLYRGPSINASYQISVHLAMWFQRR